MYCEANVRVCFQLEFGIQLFPFGSFDGYFPDYLTFSCCSKIRVNSCAVDRFAYSL